MCFLRACVCVCVCVCGHPSRRHSGAYFSMHLSAMVLFRICLLHMIVSEKQKRERERREEREGEDGEERGRRTEKEKDAVWRTEKILNVCCVLP